MFGKDDEILSKLRKIQSSIEGLEMQNSSIVSKTEQIELQIKELHESLSEFKKLISAMSVPTNEKDTETNISASSGEKKSEEAEMRENRNPGVYFMDAVSDGGFSFGNDVSELQSLYKVTVPATGIITYAPIASRFNRFKSAAESLLYPGCECEGNIESASSMKVLSDGQLEREGAKWKIVVKSKVYFE